MVQRIVLCPNIVTGRDDGLYHPNNKMTRAEVATLVNRMLNREADAAVASRTDLHQYHDMGDIYAKQQGKEKLWPTSFFEV